MYVILYNIHSSLALVLHVDKHMIDIVSNDASQTAPALHSVIYKLDTIHHCLRECVV